MSDFIKHGFSRSREQRTMPAQRFQRGDEIAEFSQGECAQSIAQQFKSLVGSYGERIAVVAPNRDSLTHATLFKQIAQIVDALNNLGIGTGDRVALVLPDGLKTAVAFLGVASGAACAPLNPNFREQEFISIFDDLRPKAVIVDADTDAAAVEAAAARSIPLIRLSVVRDDGSTKFVLFGETLAPPSRTGFASTADVALVLFTSGTTARPKLVPLTHANLLASAHNIATSLRLSPDDRCLNIMPMFHIHGLIGGLLASLVSGGSVVCPPKFAAADFFN